MNGIKSSAKSKRSKAPHTTRSNLRKITYKRCVKSGAKWMH